MTNIEQSQEQHDLAEIQEHIDHYADLKAAWKDDPLDNYLREHAEIAAEIAAVKARAASLRNVIDAGERGLLVDLKRRYDGLEWNCRKEMVALVAAQIEGKKARHVKTFHGKAGFRKQRSTQTLTVYNEGQLSRDHPEFFIAQGPKLDRTMLARALKGGLVLRNMAWLEETTPEQDRFYIDTGKAELPAPPKQAALPEKGSGKDGEHPRSNPKQVHQEC